MENCSLILNHGQFGGVLSCNKISDRNTTIVIKNCQFQGNLASKPNTYLGVDYSQNGNFGGQMYGANSFVFVTNTTVSETYTPKGMKFH